MARRHFGFKPSPRAEQLGFAAALEFMAGAAPAYKRDAAQAEVARMRERIPAAPKPRAARSDGVDIDAIHGTKRNAPLESEVVRAVSHLLAAHPLVAMAVRQNSGSASYEARTGMFAPIHFYRLLRHGNEMTIPDFWGFLKSGRVYALEAKRENWKQPRDDREFRQAAFLMLVRNCGGIGAFVRSADEAKAAIES